MSDVPKQYYLKLPLWNSRGSLQKTHVGRAVFASLGIACMCVFSACSGLVHRDINYNSLACMYDYIAVSTRLVDTAEY